MAAMETALAGLAFHDRRPKSDGLLMVKRVLTPARILTLKTKFTIHFCNFVVTNDIICGSFGFNATSRAMIAGV